MGVTCQICVTLCSRYFYVNTKSVTVAVTGHDTTLNKHLDVQLVMWDRQVLMFAYFLNMKV